MCIKNRNGPMILKSKERNEMASGLDEINIEILTALNVLWIESDRQNIQW